MTPLRYLSVCSGIEAATVAWHPLGFAPVAFAEIDRFPCAVLGHRYPNVANWGDMTQFKDWPDADIDLLVGGTPCQSYSVAGLRQGLDDPRGQLALVFPAIAARYRPAWVVWENVPGVLSSGAGRDFASFLESFSGQRIEVPEDGWQNSGLVVGAPEAYSLAWRVLDAQYAGLAQRRARVFVVGHLGDWRRAAAVLFERESLSGHPAPRREAGQDVAGTLGGSSQSGGFRTTDLDNSGAFIPCVDVASPLNAGGNATGGTRQPGTCADNADSLLIAFGVKDHGADAGDLAPTLRAGGFDTSHANGGVMPAVAYPIELKNATRSDGATGVGTPGTGIGEPTDPAGTLGQASTQAVAFAENQRGEVITSDTMGALKVGGGKPGQGYPAVAFADLADPVAANQARTYTREGAHNFRLSNVAHTAMQVRRLTPRECERLQGFPDDYTLIPYRGKPAADGPRYKALGNSMAVPVMRWIGRRIQMVDAIPEVTS